MKKSLIKSAFALVLMTVLASTAFTTVQGYGHDNDDNHGEHGEHGEHGNGGDDNHGGNNNHGDDNRGHHIPTPPPVVCKNEHNPVFVPKYSQFRKFQVLVSAFGAHENEDGKIEKGSCVRK